MQRNVVEKIILFIALGVWMPCSAFATEKTLISELVAKTTVDHSRPVIALVLAGGGAKGAAHVGVLKALEELQIPIDIITGTSMGAYVGGLYAIGMSANEIESLIYSTDWNSGYRDRVDRSERQTSDKAYEDYFQINTDLGLGWGEVRAPKGVVQGQGMMRILRETSGNLPSIDSFDSLPIRYRSVATDIINLEQVVISKGLLTDAMMASMSVPGVLPPYEIDGQLLVDGGVVNNMPVDVAKEMGADIVIAVDISTGYLDVDSVKGFMAVGNQLSNYLVRRTTDEQSKLLTEKDTLLSPAVQSMETMEFDKMPQALLWGYESAQREKEKLSGYSVSSSEYQKYIDHKQNARRMLDYGDDLVVDHIVLNNESHYHDELVLNKLGIAEGKQLSTEELEKGVRNLYALDRFETIGYHFEEKQNETTLVVDVKEKEWGPNYVNFRFFLEEDFASSSQYALGVSTNFTGLNSVGGELKLNVELGTDRKAGLYWTSPFFSHPSFFNLATIEYSKDKRNAPLEILNAGSYLDMTKDSLSTTYTDMTLEAGVGYQPQFWQDVQVGFRYIDGKVNFTTVPSFGDAKYTRQGIFTRYRLDTLDNFSLPTSGVLVDLEYYISNDIVDGESLSSEVIGETIAYESDVVHEITAKIRSAYSYRKHTLVGSAEYGLVEDKSSNNPPIRPKELGGFLRLSGVSSNSLMGENLLFGSLVYRYKWFENDFGLFTSPVYIGASLEYGGVWSDDSITISNAPLYSAGSIFTGIASPIGPIVFAFGMTEENYNSVYLILGQTF